MLRKTKCRKESATGCDSQGKAKESGKRSISEEKYLKALEEIEAARKSKKLNTRKQAFRDLSLLYICLFLADFKEFMTGKYPMYKVIKFSDEWYKKNMDRYDWDQE